MIIIKLLQKGYIGKKSDEDLELAYKYFEKAIEQKCPSAFKIINLGFIYRKYRFIFII